jgi:hypothetical protein
MLQAVKEADQRQKSCHQTEDYQLEHRGKVKRRGILKILNKQLVHDLQFLPLRWAHDD